MKFLTGVVLLLLVSLSAFSQNVPPYGYPADGNVFLKNASSGYYLADPGGSMTAGTQMIQWEYLGGYDQTFFLHFIGTDPNGTPWYSLQNMASGLFLVDWQDGKVEQDQPYGTTPNPPSELHVPIIIDGVVPATGANVSFGNPDENDPFIWTPVSNGSGGRVFVNRASGNAVSDPQSSTTEGIGMTMWTVGPYTDQTWILQ